MGYIYMLRAVIKGKQTPIYIGSTVDLNERLRQHEIQSHKSKLPLYKFIRTLANKWQDVNCQCLRKEDFYCESYMFQIEREYIDCCSYPLFNVIYPFVLDEEERDMKRENKSRHKLEKKI